MDKNINQPPVMPKSKGNLVSQEDYNEWKQYERELAAYKSAERPAEAPASSGHTPGPWKVFNPTNTPWGSKPKDYEIIRVVNDRVEHIALVEDKDDAELIARAPMMEKELQEAKEWHDEVMDTLASKDNEIKMLDDMNSKQRDTIKSQRKELQEAQQLAKLRADDLFNMEAELNGLKEELQEARAALAVTSQMLEDHIGYDGDYKYREQIDRNAALAKEKE